MADNNFAPGEGASPRAGSTLNLIAGIWLVIAPFVFGYSTVAMMNDSVITGIVVAILAVVGLTIASETWSRWLNLIAGIWLIVSAAIYRAAESPALIWNAIIMGVLVIAFSAWSISAVRHQRHERFAI